ncbi:hypothetical protein GJ496_006298 [Pomphorhynchus laevis]|nr:hypothetical protein GJ496_006298 [Pomphorhynchus laevis]
MLEAKLVQGSVLKKILDAIHPPINEATWDCTPSGIHLQAMDSFHTTLVSLMLKSDGFENYRCDRNLSLSVNLSSMAKILKCASNDDSITLKAEDDSDCVIFVFESPNEERVCEYELKLMDLVGEHLGIPDTKYQCHVKMPSSEFTRICRDLKTVGESMSIQCQKESIRFNCKGDLTLGNVTLMQSAQIDKEDDNIIIDMREPVSLVFSLQHINHCTKAGPLSPVVSLSMSSDTPLVIEYKIADIGYVRYFLAPKIDEAD